jgi:hypothetical protein
MKYTLNPHKPKIRIQRQIPADLAKMQPRLIIHEMFTVFTACSFPDLMTAMYAEQSFRSPFNFLSISAKWGRTIFLHTQNRPISLVKNGEE